MVVFPPISRYLPVMIFIGKEKQTHFTLQSTKRPVPLRAGSSGNPESKIEARDQKTRPQAKDDRPSDSRRGDPLAKPPGTADLTLRKAFRPRPALLPLRRLDRPGFGISGKPHRMDSDSQGSNSRTARPATSTPHPFARRRTPPAGTVAARSDGCTTVPRSGTRSANRSAIPFGNDPGHPLQMGLLQRAQRPVAEPVPDDAARTSARLRHPPRTLPHRPPRPFPPLPCAARPAGRG